MGNRHRSRSRSIDRKQDDNPDSYIGELPCDPLVSALIDFEQSLTIEQLLNMINVLQSIVNKKRLNIS